ncbi:MAG: hypothetical protein KBC02_03610 [Candidatus Pacebacteria bacterium]|nr:hypothetical protein [Candidatus Paceibacterota bacterium]
MYTLQSPYLVDKPLGATPLQALDVFRRVRNIPGTVKLAYAGRLDPLASGLLAVLSGEQLAHQEDYWYLPKQYEAHIVCGVTTDSFDVMGMPVSQGHQEHTAERITAVLRGLVGKIDLSVPVYSSQRFQGEALFSLARNQPDKTIIVPVRRMVISQIDAHRSERITTDALAALACERIGLVQGDFRQQEICEAWKALFVQREELISFHLTIHCGSGTYIRSIAQEIGRRLGNGAVLAGLRRTAIGAWRVTDSDVTKLSWPQ